MQWVAGECVLTVQSSIVHVDEDLVVLGLRVLPLDKASRQLLRLDVLFDNVGLPVLRIVAVSAYAVALLTSRESLAR